MRSRLPIRSTQLHRSLVHRHPHKDVLILEQLHQRSSFISLQRSLVQYHAADLLRRRDDAVEEKLTILATILCLGGDVTLVETLAQRACRRVSVQSDGAKTHANTRAKYMKKLVQEFVQNVLLPMLRRTVIEHKMSKRRCWLLSQFDEKLFVAKIV